MFKIPTHVPSVELEKLLGREKSRKFSNGFGVEVIASLVRMKYCW